jgi:hypothetical protein
VLRRKQYMQKNHTKMRDVTIYLIEERREKIINFLESWYFKNQRRMTPEEIRQNAEELQCDEQTMENLQKMFL